MNNILKTEKKDTLVPSIYLEKLEESSGGHSFYANEANKKKDLLLVSSIAKQSNIRTNIKEKRVLDDTRLKPFIFSAKQEKKSPIKTISYINNDTGKIKHFTPAAQEWFNSVYSYNNNYTKLLPVADKNLMKLFKSYLNIFLNAKILNTKGISNKYRKLSANKIFVGKGNLKHTNEKVIITSYVYNAEQSYLKTLIRNITKALFYTKKVLKKTVSNHKNGKEIVTYNRPFTLNEYINLPDHSIWHKKICFSLFWKEYKKLIGIKKLREETKNENLIEKTKTVFLNAFSNDISEFKNDISYHKLFNPLLVLVGPVTTSKQEENKNINEKLSKFKEKVIRYKEFYDAFDQYMAFVKNNYKKNYFRFAYLLMVNSAKFETPFVLKFIRLVKKIYRKKIELNIVNLNKIHLNSDIYTQTVALKLKNRNNVLLKVLNLSLSKVKLPNVTRITEKYNISNRDEYLINKIRNKYINSMFSTLIRSKALLLTSKDKQNNTNIDLLNNLLLQYFSSTDNLKIETNKKSSSSLQTKRSISLYKYIIRSLKHFKLAGVRVEAKGRLTRRFTASRSVFKVRWKGGLKNVNSSFKGLSTIMLRGDRKSNVQYSMLNSKTRNGAFGVKGWISNK